MLAPPSKWTCRIWDVTLSLLSIFSVPENISLQRSVSSKYVYAHNQFQLYQRKLICFSQIRISIRAWCFLHWFSMIQTNFCTSRLWCRFPKPLLWGIESTVIHHFTIKLQMLMSISPDHKVFTRLLAAKHSNRCISCAALLCRYHAPATLEPKDKISQKRHLNRIGLSSTWTKMMMHTCNPPQVQFLWFN